MAKQSAKEVEAIQSPIPVEFRPVMRMSDDGKTVFLTAAMPAKFIVVIGKKLGGFDLEIESAQIAGSSRISRALEYGITQIVRDGAKTKESYKSTDGEQITRELSKEEKLADATANSEAKREWLYGNRDMQNRGVDVETRECRDAVTRWLENEAGVKRINIPDAIRKATSVQNLKMACTEAGIPPVITKSLIAHGRENAARIQKPMGFDIDLDALNLNL